LPDNGVLARTGFQTNQLEHLATVDELLAKILWLETIEESMPFEVLGKSVTNSAIYIEGSKLEPQSSVGRRESPTTTLDSKTILLRNLLQSLYGFCRED
jgi:hypothetical protein